MCTRLCSRARVLFYLRKGDRGWVKKEEGEVGILMIRAFFRRGFREEGGWVSFIVVF